MIHSMTGFSKTEVQSNQLACNIEIKSVNHRFLELRIFLPKEFSYFEDTLKKTVKGFLHRGKVDIHISLNSESKSNRSINLKPELWGEISKLIEILKKDYGQSVNVNLSDLMSIKDLITYTQDDTPQEEYEALFSEAVEKAVLDIIQMRKKEGELLYHEIKTHLSKMTELISRAPEFQEAVLENYKERIDKNFSLLGLNMDEQDPRILQECGHLIDRIDITEEIERFRSHLSHFHDLLQEEGPVGRKLDFLMQEFNREANTICSKSGHLKLTEIGIELKSEIEKIREQVQNIQ
ncbi:MAG: YicC family protein [Deltaproteobacteria bacterium]|nr:YicC family protein [Deltaproteobacteria bacterium]